MIRYYGMDGQPISSGELFAMKEDESFRVAIDVIGDVIVSTVLLGLDHRFGGGGPPIIFETMVFDYGDDNDYQWRYTTKESAQAGHDHIVGCVKARTLTPDSLTVLT